MTDPLASLLTPRPGFPPFAIEIAGGPAVLALGAPGADGGDAARFMQAFAGAIATVGAPPDPPPTASAVPLIVEASTRQALAETGTALPVGDGASAVAAAIEPDVAAPAAVTNTPRDGAETAEAPERRTVAADDDDREPRFDAALAWLLPPAAPTPPATTWRLPAPPPAALPVAVIAAATVEPRGIAASPAGPALVAETAPMPTEQVIAADASGAMRLANPDAGQPIGTAAPTDLRRVAAEGTVTAPARPEGSGVRIGAPVTSPPSERAAATSSSVEATPQRPHRNRSLPDETGTRARKNEPPVSPMQPAPVASSVPTLDLPPPGFAAPTAVSGPAVTTPAPLVPAALAAAIDRPVAVAPHAAVGTVAVPAPAPAVDLAVPSIRASADSADAARSVSKTNAAAGRPGIGGLSDPAAASLARAPAVRAHEPGPVRPEAQASISAEPVAPAIVRPASPTAAATAVSAPAEPRVVPGEASSQRAPISRPQHPAAIATDAAPEPRPRPSPLVTVATASVAALRNGQPVRADAAPDRHHDAAMFDPAAMVTGKVAQPVAAPGGAPHAGIDLTRDPGLHRMIDRIETLRDAADSRDTRIRLIPDALGPVDVAVRREGEAVHVHFTASEAATRQLIADAQPRLTELAEARGVRIDRATIDGGASGQAQGGSQHGQHPQQAAQPVRPHRAPASAAVAPAHDSNERIA